MLDLFDVLAMVGEEGGKSFFSARRAEFEHLWGNNDEALKLVETAIKKTPSLFEPKRLKAEILLKAGRRAQAKAVIDEMKEHVEARTASERRSNFRPYIETRAHYLVEVGQYNEAKELFNDAALFSLDEKQAAIREIEIVQAYKNR